MGSKRAQISIEYMAVLASMLLILILLMAIFSGIYAQQALHTQQAQAAHALSILATAAKMVWAQGEGASILQEIDIPESVKLENSSIGNRSMTLYVAKVGNAFEFTDFNLSGRWPGRAGSAVMAVRNNGSHVLIRPAALISVSKTGLYFNSTSSGIITITNGANESFEISQKLVLDGSGSCKYNLEGASTLPAGSSINGTISATTLMPGIYACHLQINATPSSPASHFENVTFNIPITVVRR